MIKEEKEKKSNNQVKGNGKRCHERHIPCVNCFFFFHLFSPLKFFFFKNFLLLWESSLQGKWAIESFSQREFFFFFFFFFEKLQIKKKIKKKKIKKIR